MTDARATIAKQRALLRIARRLTVLAAVGGIAYLFMRFEFSQLPADQCCPLARFGPGDRLVIDKRPGQVGPGDAVLVMTQSGTRRLTRVDKVRDEDGRIWCDTDNPDCPGFSSDAAGWVDPRAVTGRVLLSWEH